MSEYVIVGVALIPSAVLFLENRRLARSNDRMVSALLVAKGEPAAASRMSDESTKVPTEIMTGPPLPLGLG